MYNIFKIQTVQLGIRITKRVRKWSIKLRVGIRDKVLGEIIFLCEIVHSL